MIHALLNIWNQKRKKSFFQSVLYKTEKKYAFVGAGMHSLTNLYPILRHCGISLKTICTRSSSDEALLRLFPGCILTHDLNDIVNDPAIAGVFVCSSPASHYTIVSSLLKAGKKVFVEKPPCQTLGQLRELIAIHPESVCKAGLQRRHWPGHRVAARRLRSATSYRYDFHTGPYIQGDTLTELFIHPLDYCLFLFGREESPSIAIRRQHNGVTIQLHLKHVSGISGLVELSTCHSWNAPTETLQTDSPGESLLIAYPSLVEGKQKPSRIGSIPTERILNQPAITKTYFSYKNLLLPVADLNTLTLQGFYKEVEEFVGIVEGASPNAIRNDLESLFPLYELFDKIKAAGYH